MGYILESRKRQPIAGEAGVPANDQERRPGLRQVQPGRVIRVCCLHSAYEARPSRVDIPREIRGPRPRITPVRRLTHTSVGGVFFYIGFHPIRLSEPVVRGRACHDCGKFIPPERRGWRQVKMKEDTEGADEDTAGGSGYDIRRRENIMGAMVTICILYSFVAMEAQETPRVVRRPLIERLTADLTSFIDM